MASQPFHRYILILALVMAGGQASRCHGDERASAPRRVPASNSPADVGGEPRTDRFGDPLPAGVLRRFGTVRFRSDDWNRIAALSPDAKFLVTESTEHFTVFDLKSGKPRLRLRPSGVSGEDDVPWPRIGGFSSDGKILATVVRDGSLRLWDLTTGKECLRLSPDKGFHFNNVHFPVADHAILLNMTKKPDEIPPTHSLLRILDYKRRTVLHEWTLNGELAGLSADKKTCITLEANNSDGFLSQIVLRDTLTGKPRKRFQIPDESFSMAALSPDNKTLVASSLVKNLFVWGVEDGRLRHHFELERSDPSDWVWLTSVGFACDGKHLLAGTKFKGIARWDLATGKQLADLEQVNPRAWFLSVSRDGRLAASVGRDGVIHRWDCATGKQLPTGDGYAGQTIARLSPDGRLALVIDSDGRLDVWDVKTGRHVRRLPPAGLWGNGAAFSPDGRLLACSRPGDRVALWDCHTWKLRKTITLPAAHASREAQFKAITFTPDGRSLLTSHERAGIHLWNVETGKQVWHQPKQVWHQPAPGLAVFSPDGRMLVTPFLLSDHTVRNLPLSFRDPHTGKVRSFLQLPIGINTFDHVTGLAFSPDGRTLATCSKDGTVHLFDPATRREKRWLLQEGSIDALRPVQGVAFSPDGKWLLTTHWDGTARLHELATGQEVLRFEGHDGPVLGGQIGPDGRTALTSGRDTTALYWSMRPRGVPPVKGNLDALWEDLRSADAPKAYRTIWALLDHPEAAVAMLRHRLPERGKVDPVKVQRWIRDLDSDDFQVREAAAKALGALAPSILPVLRSALAKSRSLEQRRRLKRLLTITEEEKTPGGRRVLRAVQILELIRTEPARDLLHVCAGGTPGKLLTRQARAAEARLKVGAR